MSLYPAAIQKLYVAYFTRPADVNGLAYWESVVAAGNGSTGKVSAAFAASAEYKATYVNLSGKMVIDAVYMNLFGRHAEAGGLAYWGPLLEQGVLTIDIIVTAIAGGAQGSDLIAYNNKVMAAIAFTAALNTPEKILTYASPAANVNAAAFIAGVIDAATGAASVEPKALEATIERLLTPDPLRLTDGVDRLFGTAGNDMFKGTKLSLNSATRSVAAPAPIP